MLTVQRGDAVTMLEEMGYASAAKMTPARLQLALENLPKNYDPANEKEDHPTTDGSKALLKAILKTLEKGKTLRLEESPTAEPEPPKAEPAPTPKRGPGRPSKAQKRGSAGTPAETPTKRGRGRPKKVVESNGHPDSNGTNGHTKKKIGRPVKSDEQGENKFGTRLGSRFAKVEALIGKKPKKIPDLVKEALGEIPIHEKSGGRQIGDFYRHFKTLQERGFVKKVDDGYVLAK